MESGTTRSKRILIIEDQPIIAFDLAKLLKGMGYEVAGIASSVPRAIREIINDPPDAAVLDITLVRETSFLVAEALTEHGIPFLFLTGYTETEVPLAFQANHFLTKPVVTAALKSALESLWTSGPAA
jgi:CheY-like chemotaxis protein